MPKKNLLVCDLDNTLYDWVGYFVPSFYAMVDKVTEITHCDREKLLDDFRTVHQKNRDSEHPFSLLHTETIREIFSGATRQEMIETLDPAFHAFNSTRKRTLRLHPDVERTLETLIANGIVIVAHTESKLYGAVDRLRRLNLIRFFSKVYCRVRPASIHPNRKSQSEWLGDFPMSKVVELSHHQMKPDPSVLLEICFAEGFAPSDTAYVGDSIARDILMAKRAGVYSIWAAYGTRHREEEYQKLVRISHWTQEDVEREKNLEMEAQNIRPDYSLHETFSEILCALGLEPSQLKDRAGV